MTKVAMNFITKFVVMLVGSYFVKPQSDWKIGRATFYGDEHWLWNIHQGSCGYWYLCPEEGTGWDVAALPDAHWEYQASCGRCYEVKCNPSFFTDNYGESLDRSYQCYDTEASVVVTITDTCPCNYPNNAYSNERWCCGDMDHLDLSVWAFEKLAELKWGVLGLQYRQVACDHTPYKAAPEPTEPYPPSPVPEGTVCPKSNFPLKWNWQEVQQIYRKRIADTGNGQFANPPTYDIYTYDPHQNYATDNYAHQQDSYYQYQGTYEASPNYPDEQADAYDTYDAQSTVSDGKYPYYQQSIYEQEQVEESASLFNSIFNIPPIEPREPFPMEKPIFIDSFQNGWYGNGFLATWSETQGEGLNGQSAICATIQPLGFIGFKGEPGTIQGCVSLELWLKDTSSNNVPDIDIDIGGPSGFCDPVNFQSLTASGQSDGFSRFDVYLGLFDSASGIATDAVIAFASKFNGCGPLDAADMNVITLQNNQEYEQTVCFDEVKLLG
eukprot:TRINITY_DN989_c3_g1_i2.p1 TRINITY_DN989_c3_g1~~TRINITY_DN989_c3_g1_i2.p1  ORF type:complete len:495 (+),score=65.81 TRINITY_DN989_c3_g1_i2:121-1605(+)